jgi:hypothetical protein
LTPSKLLAVTNTLETANQRTLQTKRHSAKVTYMRAAASHGKENNLFEQERNSLNLSRAKILEIIA